MESWAAFGIAGLWLRAVGAPQWTWIAALVVAVCLLVLPRVSSRA